MLHRSSEPIIADRAEFADALERLRRGHTLVRMGEGSGSCVLDGGIVYRSFDVLLRYQLIETYENREGFEGVGYYRITPAGRRFAERVREGWRARPPLERILVRLTG